MNASLDSVEPPPLLLRLKSETRLLHEETERTLDLPARLTSRQTYGQFLTVLAGFYTTAEKRLNEFPGWSDAGIDLAARSKAAVLLEDLSFLGSETSELASTELCDLPEIPDLAAGFGWLYVVEGSTLGGQFIARAVQQKLGFTAGSGCSFFLVYGDQTWPMWHQFCERVSTYHRRHPDTGDRIVEGARNLFQRFKGWMECRLNGTRHAARST